ncbi:MAG: Crp/Fnr family transcriptional regulator [Hyphomicrobiaceae bacterium]
MAEEDLGFDLGMLDDAGTAYRSYKAGEKIFVAEDEGDCMYVVRSGTVEIRYYGVVLDRIGRGGMFGEIAMIDGSTRSATAVAVEDCEVAPITRDGFLALVQRRPTFALDVMKALARRIRGMNESM